MSQKTKTGCEVLGNLWKIAVDDLAIEDPSIASGLKRARSSNKMQNIREFMEIASIKCMEEKAEKFVSKKS